MRDLVRLMLETKGYEVLAAADADEADARCAPSGPAASTCC